MKDKSIKIKENNFEETRISIDLISETVCIHCQDYESNVGHTAERCPKIVCENCNKCGHIKVHCISKLGRDLLFTFQKGFWSVISRVT